MPSPTLIPKAKSPIFAYQFLMTSARFKFKLLDLRALATARLKLIVKESRTSTTRYWLTVLGGK